MDTKANHYLDPRCECGHLRSQHHFAGKEASMKGLGPICGRCACQKFVQHKT